MKTIIFYSSVSDKSLFKTQQFYKIDIDLLESMGYNVVLSNKIYDAFLFWRYDLVFAYFYRYSFFFALTALICGRKTYFTGGIDDLDKIHASKKSYFIQKIFFKLCYLVSAKCIIVSPSDMRNVKEIIRTTKKLAYSEHSINTSNFLIDNNSDKQNYFTTIAWMGNIQNVKRKGIDKALLIFSKLKQYAEFEDFKFIILGQIGEGTHLLLNLIQEYNLKESVIIRGAVSESEKIKYLKSSKFYFQVSEYEGFGLAALEALISENIIIHSAQGGLSNPIYAPHVIVNIEEPLDRQVVIIRNLINSIDMVDIKENARRSIELYDNKRRRDDLLNIIK